MIKKRESMRTHIDESSKLTQKTEKEKSKQGVTRH
jgi:hypothetical protein